MNYNEATKIADANKHLIGKKWKGATIDEIIIAPKDSSSWDEFMKLYFSTLDACQAVLPFINEDVDVLVVCDKRRIRTQHFFGYTSIFKLPESFNAITEIAL